MLHRLCGPPSIPLSFTLASILPRRCTYRVSYGTDGSSHQHLVHIVYSVDYQGIQSCSLPTLSRLSVSIWPGARLRHRCSSRYLQISPLHLEFQLPLHHSSHTVSSASSRLSRDISHQTYVTAYTPFTPNDSEQRLPLTYYRGCWHVISRGLFLG